MNRMYVQCLFLPACLFLLGIFIVLDLYNDGWTTSRACSLDMIEEGRLDLISGGGVDASDNRTN